MLVIRELRAHIGLLQGIIALTLISVGVALFSVPAALIVAGILILADKVL